MPALSSPSLTMLETLELAVSIRRFFQLAAEAIARDHTNLRLPCETACAVAGSLSGNSVIGRRRSRSHMVVPYP